jgi:hypothetical protein
VRRRKTCGRNLAHEVQRGPDGVRRTPEPEHHPVADPLHDLTSVPPGTVLHGVRQPGGDRGRLLVTSLLGQTCEPCEIHEADRRRRPGRERDAGRSHRLLDVFDLVLRPHELLLPAVGGEHGSVEERDEFDRRAPRGLHALAHVQAGAEKRHLEAGVIDLVLGGGGPAEDLGVHGPQPHRRRSVDGAQSDGPSHQRRDRPLRLDHHVGGARRREPERRHDRAQGLEGQADLGRQLRVRLRNQGRGSFEQPPVLREREGQSTFPDGRRHRVHRDPAFLTGPYHPDPEDVDAPERPLGRLPLDEDAGIDEPVHLLFRDTRRRGELGS